jgi:hypothetical protein
MVRAWVKGLKLMLLFLLLMFLERSSMAMNVNGRAEFKPS